MDNATLNLLKEARNIVLNYKLNDRFRNLVERYYGRNPLLLYKNRPFIYYIQILSSFSPRFRRYFRQTGFRKIPEFLNICASDTQEFEHLRLFLSGQQPETRKLPFVTPFQQPTTIQRIEKAAKQIEKDIEQEAKRKKYLNNLAKRIKTFEQELSDPTLRARLLVRGDFTKKEVDFILKHNLHQIKNFKDEAEWRKAFDKAASGRVSPQELIAFVTSAKNRFPKIPIKASSVATILPTPAGAFLGYLSAGVPGIFAGGAGAAMITSVVKKGHGEDMLRFFGRGADMSINFFSGLTQVATTVSPFKKFKLLLIIGGVFLVMIFIGAAGLSQTGTKSGTPGAGSSSSGPSGSPSPSPILASASCPVPNGTITCGSSKGTGIIRPCHCAPGYAYSCDPNSRGGKAVDIITRGGSSDGDPIYLPTVHGQTLKWYFRGDFDDNFGATLRVFQSEPTAAGVWTIHFVHSKQQTCTPPRPFSAGPCFSPGQEITNLAQPVAFMDKNSSNRDGSNIHIHVSIGLNVDPWDQNNLQENHPGWKFADAEMNMCTGLSIAIPGSIAKLLPNPLPPPISDWQNTKTIIIAQVNSSAVSLETYRNAATATGIPWEILAGIHFIEGSNNPNQSLVSGRRIGEFEPDVPISACNSGSAGPGIPIRIGAGCGFDTLLNSAIYTGNHLKNKIGGFAPENYEQLVTNLSLYNGGGNRNCYVHGDRDNPRTPYTGCPKAFFGEDDIYPMSKFDQRHANMYLVYCGDRITCNPPRPYTQYGVMTIVRALAEP